MNTDKHNAAVKRMAEAHVTTLLRETNMILRKMDETGITIQCDSDVADIAIANVLQSLASWWGYRCGECAVEITPLEAGFFAAGKSGTITFA